MSAEATVVPEGSPQQPVDREAAIDRLHAVPLEAFVSERTRLSRELRNGGDRPAAAEIAKQPKPSAAAWALNHVAREDPGAVGEWLEAAEALRDASRSAGEGGGDALRLAIAEHRSATSRLIAVVRDRAQPSGRPLSEAMLDRVRALLQAATTDARLAEELGAGRISEDPEARESEPPVTLTSRNDPAVAKRPRRAVKAQRRAESPPPAAQPDREAGARAERRAELERRVDAASEGLERLREEAVRRAAMAESVDARLEEARRALRRLESAAEAAHQAAREVDESVTAAEHELQKLRIQRSAEPRERSS